MYYASAQSWPTGRAFGPGGVEFVSQFVRWHVPDFYLGEEGAAQRAEQWRTNPETRYVPALFLPAQAEQRSCNAGANVSQGAADNSAATPAGNTTDGTAASNGAAGADGAATSGTTTSEAGTAANAGQAGGNAANPAAPVTDAAAPGNTAPANGGAAPQANQDAQATPDARATEGGGATAGAANGATQGPVTSAGMFQQQQNEGAAVPGTRSESGGAFPWNGNGSTVSYEGRQITTTVQLDGSITYRTSAGAVPFDRATDANGNVLTEVVGCTEQEGDGPQECTFRAAA